MSLPTLDITGGKLHQREYAKRVVNWCLAELNLPSHDHFLKVQLKKLDSGDYHGYCQELGNHHYKIVVDVNQPLRQWVMTLVHELIHLRQYKEGTWTGDGEEEAWGQQAELTDKLWAADIL